MSKQDSQFFNMFSIVIGVLVAIALVLFAIARAIGTPFEEQRALEDRKVQAQIAERIAPVGRVAVAGRDNSALANRRGERQRRRRAGGRAAGERRRGLQAGLRHVPHAGHRGRAEVRRPRRVGAADRQGLPTLYDHAIKGFQGQGGVMPARAAARTCRTSSCASPSISWCS